jgi:anthranilate phosphoribosyltransferase
MIKNILPKLLRRENLTQREAESAMADIMGGTATPAQIGGYLIALRMKGETVDEITGSARAMRTHATPVQPHRSPGVPLFDTAGTGGDGAGTFNVSTAAALVVAGSGRTVAKHGNRAASSACGSADVLGALGVNLELTAEQVARCIDDVGIGFLFAPKFHPAMKHAVGPRKELGQRTIFNVLGPLTNPAGASQQLIGVYDPALTETIAGVFRELGGGAVYVVHGHGGLDELTTTGPNRVSHLKDGAVKTFELDAQSLGLRRADPAELKGGSPDDNARIMRALLGGTLDGAVKDVVLLNAAAAIAADSGDLAGGLAEARRSLDSGAALAKLEALVKLSSELGKS